MPSNITIHTEKSELIWDKASEFLINWLRLYHNIGQKTLLLLSGGSVTRLYSDLAQFINTSDLNFDFLAIGQVDERFKPEQPGGFKSTKEINAEFIRETGLWQVCQKKNIPYNFPHQEGTLEEAAKKYNKQLSDLFEHFPYKIGVLGIGEDSHTAGLLPGYERVWNIDKYIIGYNLGQNNPRGLFCQHKFKQRISVTPRALRQLDHTIVVAVGEKKKEAIDNVINPLNIDNFDKYPAAILQKIKKVDLFTDILDLTKFPKGIK